MPPSDMLRMPLYALLYIRRFLRAAADAGAHADTHYHIFDDDVKFDMMLWDILILLRLRRE